jgi:hypothetical protein
MHFRNINMANSALAKHLCNSGVNELKDFISHSEEEFTSNDSYIECTRLTYSPSRH